MNSADQPRAAEAFWSFSLAFYDRPDVAAVLLELQDTASLDVNLMLFALWLGLSGRGRTDLRLIEDAHRAVQPVRFAVISPLRRLRRDLKTAADPDIQRLRESIKMIELDAEKAAQARLAALAPAIRNLDISACLGDAEANFALVVGSDLAAGRAAQIISRELRAFAGAT